MSTGGESTALPVVAIARRRFLKLAAGGAGLALLSTRVRSAGAAGAGPPDDPIVATLIAANDDVIRSLLARQEQRRDSRWRGGLLDGHGIYSPRETAGFIGAMACGLTAPGSAFHRSAALVEPLELATRCLLSAQHEDGTVDLPVTNFHSPPDTAFTFESIGPAIALLRALDWSPARPALAGLTAFARRVGEALVVGGVHTPNHRWVVSAALARLHALFGDPRYVARIDTWLAETVDIDPDGQFTEKSTSVYSPVVDQALLTIGRLLERPALFDPVRRNLEMTLYYVQPDGEVVTEASRRQDQYTRGSMAKYYYSYRWLAQHDDNGRFAAMTRQIERTAADRLTDQLPAFLEDAALRRSLPPDQPLPTEYAKVFAYSSLARIRRGDVSATILANNSTFFSLHKRRAVLEAVRLAAAFFGKGQFSGEKLEADGNRYVLRQTLEGPYFQPLTRQEIEAEGGLLKLAPNGTLAAGARALRAHSNVQHLQSVVTLAERAGSFAMEVNVTGTADVPVALELAFRRGGKLTGVEPLADVPDGFVLRAGMGAYTVGDETIAFGPGHAEHTYTQLRGALPKSDGLSVYLTGLTPFRTTLTFS